LEAIYKTNDTRYLHNFSEDRSGRTNYLEGCMEEWKGREWENKHTGERTKRVEERRKKRVR